MSEAAQAAGAAAVSVGASVESAAAIAGEAAGVVVVRGGGGEQEAVKAAREAAGEAGGSAEAQTQAAEAASRIADTRHRGHYVGVDDSLGKGMGGRGSLVHDAASVGAGTAAAGGTPSAAGEEGVLWMRRGRQVWLRGQQ